MMKPILQPELQRRTLRLYGELVCRRSDWAGALVFAAFPSASASGLAAASSLAGAASLLADADAESMKAHFRDGAFDFVVNTLDEALRAIKNEVRQRRPIAIGLIAKPTAVIAEAAERGLAADVLLLGSSDDAERTVAAKDALLLSAEPSPEFTQWLGEEHWREAESLLNAADLSKIAGDPLRQRWLRELATYQRSIRRGSRILWMSEEELSHLTRASQS